MPKRLNILRGYFATPWVIACGGSAAYFAKKEAAGIAAAYSEVRILDMPDTVFSVNSKSRLNLNLGLTTAYLTARIMQQYTG